MAKRKGNNCKLKVESSTPGTFNAIVGQQTLSWEHSLSSQDTTTKDDNSWGSSISALQSITFNLGLIPDLPDANGYDRLRTLILARDPFNVQVVDGATVIFEGAVTPTGRSGNLDVNDVGKASCTLITSGAPVTNEL